jgi:hypothetical protein
MIARGVLAAFTALARGAAAGLWRRCLAAADRAPKNDQILKAAGFHRVRTHVGTALAKHMERWMGASSLGANQLRSGLPTPLGPHHPA